jgi:hypothetical protein
VFGTIFGIPAHPLYVHAAVVFIPLLALFAVLYAVVPGWRPKIGWTVAVLAVIAPISALFAKLAGDKFFAGRFPDGAPPNVLQHRHYGTITFWVTLGLAFAAALLLLVHHWEVKEGLPPWASVGSRLLALGVAAFAVYYVARTGDSGAAAVWGRS